jgi:hypothetical protein
MSNPSRPSPPPRPPAPHGRAPIGFPGHCAAAFADEIALMVGACLLMVLAVILSGPVPEASVPDHAVDSTVLSLFALYTETEILFTASPGNWLASLVICDAGRLPAPPRSGDAPSAGP